MQVFISNILLKTIEHAIYTSTHHYFSYKAYFLYLLLTNENAKVTFFVCLKMADESCVYHTLPERCNTVAKSSNFSSICII